ncbi:MAG: hypothetical protein ACK4RW_02710 [Rehaibacterium terrae]|uniref:hypothetical protein n=1 Tax=Rehaibacterium terrae TaxID=1341696 RepID=UPI00391AC180
MSAPDRVALGVPLWPLPLLAAALPVLATHLAWWLSVQGDYIPLCNPYLEGCTSISRAARHGLGNDLFRMAMLPCATLQALFWLAAHRWLRRHDPGVGPWVLWLGVIGAGFLAVYVTFLGTEGAIYQVLRRYGVHMYFAGTFLALMATLRRLARWPGEPAYRLLLTVALGMLSLGIASVAVDATVADRALKERLENILEWNLGLWLTAMFAVFAWRWRREGLRVGLE